jgi:NADH-quinone oxidoreductase subunit J
MVFVYAGAVVALFLFIIMLLDVKGGERKPFGLVAVVGGALAAGLLATGVISLAYAAAPTKDAPVVIVNNIPTLKNYAELLFTQYLLPVQVVGFLLLIAMLGVIVLSKRHEGLEDIK